MMNWIKNHASTIATAVVSLIVGGTLVATSSTEPNRDRETAAYEKGLSDGIRRTTKTFIQRQQGNPV